MQTLGIRELQTNPAVLTKSIENKEIALITKHSKPIGIAVSLNDTVITQGLKTALLIEAYKRADLSLGQFSNAMEVSQEEAMLMLSAMGIDVIDYDFADDFTSLEKML